MLDLVCRCKYFEVLGNAFVAVLAGEGEKKRSMNKFILLFLEKKPRKQRNYGESRVLTPVLIPSLKPQYLLLEIFTVVLVFSHICKHLYRV